MSVEEAARVVASRLGKPRAFSDYRAFLRVFRELVKTASRVGRVEWWVVVLEKEGMDVAVRGLDGEELARVKQV